MRDGPFHTSTILAGLWGANNYLDMEKAVEIRKRLLDVPARQWNIISSITSYYDHHHDHHIMIIIIIVIIIITIGFIIRQWKSYDQDVLDKRVWPIVR